MALAGSKQTGLAVNVRIELVGMAQVTKTDENQELLGLFFSETTAPMKRNEWYAHGRATAAVSPL